MSTEDPIHNRPAKEVQFEVVFKAHRAVFLQVPSRVLRLKVKAWVTADDVCITSAIDEETGAEVGPLEDDELEWLQARAKARRSEIETFEK